MREPLTYVVVGLAFLLFLAGLEIDLAALRGALLRAASVPVPSVHLAIGPVVMVFAAFFIAAVLEELGWTAYVADRITDSSGVLSTGIVIGVAWASWHFVPLWQANRSPMWIMWHALETVASRVLIVWMYTANHRCVFLGVLYHTSDNVSWLLFPEWGSHYSPGVTGPLTIAAACVAFKSGPRAPSVLEGCSPPHGPVKTAENDSRRGLHDLRGSRRA